jgi:phosphatidylglycerophosphate synthase
MKAQTESVKRTWEIEEFTNRYLIHPVSSWFVTLFAKADISPNTVSLLGMVFGVSSAVCFYYYHQPQLVFLGLFLMFSWHVMDGADGQLARLTGKVSDIGMVIDGICDYAAFIAIYLALTLALDEGGQWWIWAIGLVAGFSHAIQSSAFEFRRQEYDFWVHGKVNARLRTLDEVKLSGREGSTLWRLLGALYYYYLRTQYWVAGIDEDLSKQMEKAAADTGGGARNIRALYRDVNLPAVKQWTLLSANKRTFVIFLTCLFGYPLYYFLFEAVILNLVLVYLLLKQRGYNFSLKSALATGRV